MSNTLERLTDYSVDMDAENIMDVRTEKLDPIVSSAYRYTFRLDTSAYLDKNTMLLFKCKAKTGEGANNCRLNCWNGGLGAIQNVELRIGDFSVQRINNVNLWSTMNHLYSSTPEVQNKKFSHYLQNGLKYQVRNSQGAADEAMVGTIQPDNDNSGINYGRADTRAGAAVNSHKIEEDESNNQLVGIPLGMLLPILNTRDCHSFYSLHIRYISQLNSTPIVVNLVTRLVPHLQISHVPMVIFYLVMLIYWQTT